MTTDEQIKQLQEENERLKRHLKLIQECVPNNSSLCEAEIRLADDEPPHFIHRQPRVSM